MQTQKSMSKRVHVGYICNPVISSDVMQSFSKRVHVGYMFYNPVISS